MRSLLLFALLGLVAFAFSENSDVIVLTAENFDEVVNKNDLILVEFYAPWCGHCKKLAPEYEQAATELKESNIPIANVDADNEENRPLASRFGIRGFPTLKVFRNGNPTDYQGERTAAAIVSYMKKQALPAITELTSVDKIKEFSVTDRVVVIGFFDSANSEEYQKFKAVSEELRDNFVFGSVVGIPDANKEFEVTETPTVILFKQFDEGKNVLNKADFDNLAEFVKTNSIPLIDEIGPQNYQNYAESGIPLAYIFTDLTVEGQKDELLNKLKSVAEQTKGKLNWVYIDWSKYARHSERLGLSGKVVPAFAIEKIAEGTHFAFDETAEITADTIKAWIDQFLSGNVEPTIKSEEIPTENNGPVKVVVAKNFDEIVKDNNKAVFVEFYAPWCGHCKKLAPTFDQLGETFQSVDSVVIAKIDATANDIDASLGVRGFPTLKLFPANGDKAPIDYEGDRSLDDMILFIHKNAGVQFEKPAAAPVKDEL